MIVRAKTAFYYNKQIYKKNAIATIDEAAFSADRMEIVDTKAKTSEEKAPEKKTSTKKTKK